MHKMRCTCIRQENKKYFSFSHNFIEIMILAFGGFAWRKSRAILMEMNVDIDFEHSYISYGMH